MIEFQLKSTPVKRILKKLTNGPIIAQTMAMLKYWPSTMMPRSKNGPKLSSLEKAGRKVSGKNARIILLPSNGGMGNKLKNAKTRLITTEYEMMNCKITPVRVSGGAPCMN